MNSISKQTTIAITALLLTPLVATLAADPSGQATPSILSEVTTTSGSLKPSTLAVAIRQAAGELFSVRLVGPDTLAVAAYELPGNHLAVHVVNYAATPASGVQLALGPRWSDAKQLQCFRPKATPQTLAACKP